MSKEALRKLLSGAIYAALGAFISFAASNATTIDPVYGPIIGSSLTALLAWIDGTRQKPIASKVAALALPKKVDEELTEELSRVRALSARIRRQNQEVTAEEAAEFQALSDQIDDLDKRIDEKEKAESVEALTVVQKDVEELAKTDPVHPTFTGEMTLDQANKFQGGAKKFLVTHEGDDIYSLSPDPIEEIRKSFNFGPSKVVVLPDEGFTFKHLPIIQKELKTLEDGSLYEFWLMDSERAFSFRHEIINFVEQNTGRTGVLIPVEALTVATKDNFEVLDLLYESPTLPLDSEGKVKREPEWMDFTVTSGDKVINCGISPVREAEPKEES